MITQTQMTGWIVKVLNFDEGLLVRSLDKATHGILDDMSSENKLVSSGCKNDLSVR